MPKLKVGDKIKCIYNDNGTSEYVGETGTVTCISRGSHPYSVSFAGATFSGEELELLGSKNNMSLKEKFVTAFLPEPEKSFRKAGITNGDGMLTSEGEAVFMAYLLKKHGDEFKKDVVDELVKEDKEDSKK